MSLQVEIDEARAEIRTDSYALSIGEWISLYENNELDIHPEFQRFFRWTLEQKSRLVESILLGIPVPQIFVAQRADGEARHFMGFAFNPKNLDELRAVSRDMTAADNVLWRQALSFWEMAASLVLPGSGRCGPVSRLQRRRHPDIREVSSLPRGD